MSVERRLYFRIDDRVLIKYRLFGERDLSDERRFIFLNEVRASNLHAALMGIDMSLQETISELRNRDKTVASALDLINRKLNLIERVVALEQMDGRATSESEHEPFDVNISGGGISFVSAEPIDVGALLAIDLIVLPSNHPMRAIGRVVDCRSANERRNHVAIEFVEIRDEDRETLIQHVIKKQAAELRDAREQAASGSAA